MDLLTIAPAALAAMRPSAFTPGRAAPVVDALVGASMTEDFPRIRTLLPEAYSLDRLGSAIFNRIPWLLGLGHDLSAYNVLELGCGKGLKAIPWSRLCGHYFGVDLDADAIEFARRAARVAGGRNLEFLVANAAEVVRTPARFGIQGRIDMIVLFAVLEHLTLPERRFVLGLCREVLRDGGLVVLAETPNRLIPHDGHSTWLPFFQTLPPELALEYIARSPREGAVAAVAAGEEALYRFGQAASYHEFDLWLAGEDGRMPAIVSDAWTHWPSFDEPPRRDELALNDFFAANGVGAAPAFARYWLDIVFDGAAPAGSAPPTPRAALPEDLRKGRIESDPRHYGADTLLLEPKGEARYALGGAKGATLFLDLGRSAGEIEVTDGAGRTTASFDVAALRAARFKRWHDIAAIDLSAVLRGDALRLKAARGSTLVSTGLLLR